MTKDDDIYAILGQEPPQDGEKQSSPQPQANNADYMPQIQHRNKILEEKTQKLHRKIIEHKKEIARKKAFIAKLKELQGRNKPKTRKPAPLPKPNQKNISVTKGGR